MRLLLRIVIPAAAIVATGTALSPHFARARGGAPAALRAALARGADIIGSLKGATHALLPGGSATTPPPRGAPELAREPAAVVASTGGPSYLGVVLARASANIAPRFDGRIATVSVRVGDTVVQGTVLATLAVPTLDYEIRAAEAELRTASLDVERASTEISQATERLARKERLDQEHLALADDVTGADYASRLAKTRLSSARAVASERRAQVEKLRQDKADTQIIAPFDGVVAARYADPGMSVHALAPVVRLITMGDLLARFAVPQSDVAHLHVGDRVNVRTLETNRDLRATVERIAAEVEPASRMIFVEAKVDTADTANAVPSGELARVTLAAEAP